MHEQEKLDEAQYFFNRLSQLPEPVAFRFELSAFLSAARSALQYALEEARSKPGGQAWFDAQVSARSLIRFLKDKRDVSIHKHPVRPRVVTTVAFTDVVRVSDSVHIQVVNAEGKLVQEVSTVSPASPAAPPTPPVVTYRYTFADWTGSEDVQSLCSQYLAEVRTVVSEGVTQRFLTP